MQLIAFSAVLWTISEVLVAVLVAYAVIGTVVALWVFGTPLIQLNFWQLRREADFRFSLMRVRENAESIAFYRGEKQERAHIDSKFNKVINNFVASNQFVGDFLNYVAVTKGNSKYQNIGEYLQSPRSNLVGISAAWTAFIMLHNIKMDILQQLDRQVPGQEGWVVTVPGGVVKFVNRFEFTRANRAVNPE
jgi:ABC-type uncharacterized transport system fused permease/ATPase subunit